MNCIDVFTRYDDREGCFSASDKLNKLKTTTTKKNIKVRLQYETCLPLNLGRTRPYCNNSKVNCTWSLPKPWLGMSI